MTNINGILFKVEGFRYAASLGLDMVYYHIQIDKTQVTYLRLFSHGENSITIIY